MNGLLIREPYVSWILEGKKRWEIRGSATKVRGRIALIRSGSGLVVGTAELVEVVGPLSLGDLRRNASKLNRKASEITELSYARTHAWVLAKATALAKPVHYVHPAGAVIWVKLSAAVTKKLGARSALLGHPSTRAGPAGTTCSSPHTSRCSPGTLCPSS